jgi:hypothetical protein
VAWRVDVAVRVKLVHRQVHHPTAEAIAEFEVQPSFSDIVQANRTKTQLFFIFGWKAQKQR